MKIAWIGTGVMGTPMIKNLSKASFDLQVYNRTISKAEALKSYAKVCYSIEEVVKDADVIFTILGYPSDVKEVYEKIFNSAKQGAICVDMTTSSVDLAIEIYKKGIEKNISCLDAPVTGGDVGAINGTLSIMVGGNQEAYLKVLPLLEKLGTNITYVGLPGNGQKTKLTNQIAIAGALLGVVESISFAVEQELNLKKVFDVISTGSAKSTQLSVNGTKIMDLDFKPGFFIKHFLKDLKLVLENTKIDLNGVKYVVYMLEKLVDNNMADLGTQALILYYLDLEYLKSYQSK